MNKKLLIFSVVGNVIMALLLVVTWSGSSPRDPSERRAEEAAPGGSEAATNAPVAPAAAPGGELQWSAIESPDYIKYIRNLRAAGCPEETIRDIILADINKLFAERWRRARPPAPAGSYWREPEPRRPETLAEAGQRHQAEIERAAMVQELLGVDIEAEMGRYEWDPDAGSDGSLDFLPLQKRILVRDWIGRGRLETLRLAEESAAKGESAEVLKSRKRKLEAGRQRELATLLTPAEQKEFWARRSALADQLRKAFAKIEITEKEYRRFFELLSGQPGALLSDARLLGERGLLNDPFLQPRLQEALGIGRYEAFQNAAQARSRDPFDPAP